MTKRHAQTFGSRVQEKECRSRTTKTKTNTKMTKTNTKMTKTTNKMAKSRRGLLQKQTEARWQKEGASVD